MVEVVDLERLATSIQFDAFNEKEIEGTITVERGRFDPGRGVSVTRTYDFCGLRYLEQVSYESDSEFKRDVVNDCINNLSYMATGSFDVSFVGREGDAYKFRIKTNPEFERNLKSYSRN